MDWMEYNYRRNAIIPEKELLEQKYDYQCNTCLDWKTVNDFELNALDGFIKVVKGVEK